MIDTTAEVPVPLAQAAAELPRRRHGQKAHASTLYRWSTTGCRGVVLETIQVGATRCTSREALQRFYEQLTLSGRAIAANAERVAPPIAAVRSAAQRQRRSEEAMPRTASAAAHRSSVLRGCS
jgi:hypothetical protein